MGIKIGKILRDLSPVASAATGKGPMGKAFVEAGRALGPFGGILPQGAARLQDSRDDKADMRQFFIDNPYKKGGKVKKMAKGGSTASKRADGCATKGKTKGKFC